MRSSLLDDFENMNLPRIQSDVTYIISLNSAFDILISCEERDCDYSRLPEKMKDSVDRGIRNGILEVAKIKQLLGKCLEGNLKNDERVYLYTLLSNFAYLNRNDLVAQTLLKDKLSESDEQMIKNAIKRLQNLLEDLERLRKNKRIKNTELAEQQLDKTFGRIQNNLFSNWLAIVNTLEPQEV